MTRRLIVLSASDTVCIAMRYIHCNESLVAKYIIYMMQGLDNIIGNFVVESWRELKGVGERKYTAYHNPYNNLTAEVSSCDFFCNFHVVMAHGNLRLG